MTLERAAVVIEPILEPDLPIIDAHHHLWFLPSALIDAQDLHDPMWTVIRRNARYLLDEFMADVATGHNVRATVFVEAHAMYRASGPRSLRSVGEVEFANGIAAMTASGLFGETQLCAGIVGNADLRLGAAVEEVLEAHVRAGGGRYRGVRNVTVSDPDKSGPLRGFAGIAPGILGDRAFRAGFTKLQDFALSYDAVVFEPQLPELIELARAFPETPIMLDHLGIPLGVSSYAMRRAERFGIWRENIRTLSRCSNVSVKLGGLGQNFGGFRSFLADPPASSRQIAEEWRPYIETCIEAFGADRCMFESNFPVDSGSCTYAVLWNVFKRLAAGASKEEKAALFSGTACRVYRLAT